MPDNKSILTDLINSLKTDVINSMQSKGRYATGETIAALETVATEDNGQLLAPFWIDALEYGRKPTAPGAPASDPTLFERIVIWLASKGLDLNPYAVKNKIHKRGYPGKPGVLTEPLGDDNVNSRLNEVADQLALNQQQAVLDLFDVFDNI